MMFSSARLACIGIELSKARNCMKEVGAWYRSEDKISFILYSSQLTVLPLSVVIGVRSQFILQYFFRELPFRPWHLTDF